MSYLPPGEVERRSPKQMQRKSVRKRSSKARTASKQRSENADEEILRLVRTGVENFVLQHSTIQEFLTALREITDREDAFSHPLTKAAFSRIVKEAIRKRELRLKQ